MRINWSSHYDRYTHTLRIRCGSGQTLRRHRKEDALEKDAREMEKHPALPLSSSMPDVSSAPDLLALPPPSLTSPSRTDAAKYK